MGEPVDDHEILHIRGLTLPGEVFGLGCVEIHRRALGNMSAVEDFAGNFWRDNASPAAVLKNSGNDLSANEAAEFKAQWISMMRGNREPVVLNKDIDYVPIPLSNNDSQFLETRVHGLTDVANIVGIPGYFIGAEASSMTYSNISEESLNLVKLHLRAEIVAVERAFTSLMPEGIKAKFNLDDLLRADTKSRYETYDIALKAGWRTKDEVRVAEGLPLLPPTQAAIDSTLVYAAVAMINAGAEASDVLEAFGIPEIKFDPSRLPSNGATNV
jgi:HK97 family phage portal protein